MSTKKRATPRQERPVNPGQHEIAIMRHMMEEAIATRVRVEDAAMQVQQQLQNANLIIAGLLLQFDNQVAILPDDDLDMLADFTGFQINRVEDGVEIRLQLAEPEDEDETEE